MNIKEIEDLIKFVSKSGVSEVELECKDFKIIIKTTPKQKESSGNATVPQVMMVPAPTPSTSTLHASAPQTAYPQEQKLSVVTDSNKLEESKYITVKSPMIGTLYKSSAPDKPPFVNVGDEIKPGKVICIIEAMKLFNEIEAEISGRIVKILVDNASPVEYDQPLFLVEPL